MRTKATRHCLNPRSNKYIYSGHCSPVLIHLQLQKNPHDHQHHAGHHLTLVHTPTTLPLLQNQQNRASDQAPPPGQFSQSFAPHPHQRPSMGLRSLLSPLRTPAKSSKQYNRLPSPHGSTNSNPRLSLRDRRRSAASEQRHRAQSMAGCILIKGRR